MCPYKSALVFEKNHQNRESVYLRYFMLFYAIWASGGVLRAAQKVRNQQRCTKNMLNVLEVPIFTQQTHANTHEALVGLMKKSRISCQIRMVLATPKKKLSQNAKIEKRA